MWRKQLEAGEIEILVQGLSKRHSELPKVPTAVELAKTPRAKELIKVGVQDRSTILRPYSLPPGTPKERVDMIRQAFSATMKDQDFLAEAKRSKLDINPLTGEKVEVIVQDMFEVDPKTLAELNKILAR